MAKKENAPSQEKFKTMIGGQALIEGIMMRGPEKDAIVVRSSKGLQTEVFPRKKKPQKSPGLIEIKYKNIFLYYLTKIHRGNHVIVIKLIHVHRLKHIFYLAFFFICLLYLEQSSLCHTCQ